MSLDEALKFESLPVFQAEGQDEHPLNATVPSRSGLQWITVPKNCVGLVLRIEGGSTLQLIRIQDESQKVAFSIQIPVAVVHLAASDDGRLVCLACLDGSLRCYNATNDSFSERWTLPNAHSHVVSTLNESARNSRDVAASAAGPVRSLQFEPNSYTVLLVDAGRQTLTFVQADSTSKPVPNVIDPSYQVTCAAWAPTSESGFAIGKADGTIEIYQYSRSGQSFFSSKSQIDAPVEDDDEGQGKWVCTHLQWLRSESLAAGYCRVTSTDEEDDDDDDQDGEEDDGAEHEASFYVFYLSSDWTETKRVPLGDVVAFFSVPKHGRHVFYSCCVSTSQTEPLLLVASNVSSDVAVVALDEDEFRIIDIPEGANAAAPTDADDEFTYPIGIDAVVCTDGIRLLLNATDGSLSSWKLQNIVDSNFLIYPSEKSTELPTVVVDASLGQISSPNDKADSSASANQFGSGTEAPSFGFSSPPVSGSVAFGSGSATPSFGSGPFSFATAITQSTDASKPVFGATSSLGSSQPVFGEVSSLGANRITEERGTAPDVVSSSFSEPIFGSGKSAPVFGSSSFSFNSIGFGNLAKSPPFGAFRGAPAVSPAAAFAKPLFGTSPEPKATPVHLDAETTSSKPKASADGVPKSLTAEQNPYAEKAAAAFDLVDQRKAGKLPVSKMEVILEELGEGFHGEELENQIALIDDNGTGFLSKEAFVDWCVKLSEQTDRGRTGGHNVELDSDEEKEWQEQVELVETLFSELGEDGGNTLQEAKFAELVEGLGSTYCEDGEHGRAKKTLANDGIISITDFLDWYKNYLFGDDEEDYEEQEEQEGPGEMASAGEAKARPATNWGDTFKQEEGSWKCDVCSVLNKPGQTQCGACEAPRPGFEGKASDKAGLGGSVKASIGSSGFVFGGPSSGFSFGSNSASNVPTQASSAVSRPEPGSTANTLAANPSISSTTPVGFVFVGVPVKTEDAAVVSAPKTTTPEAEKAARAFDLFDEDKSSKVPVSMMESILDELGEGFHGEELEQQIAEIDNKGTGFLSKEAFVDWYVKLSEQTDRGRTGGHTVELDSDEEEEWQEQVELVETLFSELGEDGGNTLQEAKFAELVKGLGSTYCEDGEHGRAKMSLANDAIISITDFLDWYKNYLFGDDEEDYEEQEEQEGPGEMASAGEAKARPAANWGDTFKQEEGSWKCDVCSVLNKPVSCVACEAPRPGFESKASDKAGLGGSIKASIGSSGFTFGIAAVTAAGPPSEEDKMEKETTKGFSSVSSSYPPVPSNAPTAFDGASSSSKPASSSSSSYPPVPDKAPSAFAGTTAAKTASSSSSSSYPPVTNKAPSAFDGAGATGKIVLSSSSSYPPVPDKAPSAFDGAAAGKPASSLSSYPPVPKKAPSAFDVAATGKTSSSLSNYPPVPKKAPSAFDGAAAGKTASSLSSYPPVPKKARSAFDGAAVTTGSTSSSSYPPVPKKAPSSFGGAAATTGSSYPPVPSKAPSAFGAAASSSSSYPPVSSKASSASDGSAVERASSSSSSYPPVPNKAPSAFDGTPPTTVSSSSSYPPIPNKAPSVFTEAAAKTTSLSSSSYPPVPSKAPSAFAGASSSSSYPLLPTKAPSAFAGASSSSYPPVPSKAPSAFAGASPLSSYPPVPSKAPSAFAGASPLSSYPPVPSKARSAFDGAAATTASLLSPSYTPTQNDSSSAFGRSTSKDVFAFAPASSFLSKSSELATHNTARGSVGVFGFSSSSNEPSKFVPTKESSKFVPTQACSPLGYVRTTFEGPPPFCVSSKMSSSAPSNQSATSTDGIVSSEHKSTPTPTLWGTGRAGSVSLSKEQRVAKVESENTRRSMKGEPFQKNLSESTRKYISLVTLMEQSLASVRYDVDGGDRESAQRIADLAKNRQKLFASVAKAKALVGQVWERVPQLIASRAAVTARVEELHGILDQSNGGTQRDVLETQPLDMESERLQSSLSSKGMRVLAAVDVLRSRCRLWEDLVHENPKEMSEVLLNGHEQVRQLEEKSKNMKKRIIDLDTIQSLRVRPSSSNLITVVKQSARSGGQFDWNDIDGSSFKSLVAPSRMTLELQRTRNKKMDSSRSLRSRYVRESTAVRSTLSTANSETTFDEKSLFSPPQNVSPRDAWDQPSTTDQSQARRMMFDSPRDLRETSVEDESKAALRSYGTSFGGTRGPHMSDRVSTKTPQPVLDRQNESQQHGRSMLAARSVVNQTEKATLSQSPSRNLERQGQEGSLATTSRAKRISPGELEKDGSYDTSSPRGLTSGLDGIAGLGESIPSGGNRQTDDKNEKPGFQGLSLSSPKRDNNGEPTSNTDYHAILTQFYEKHNPSKLGSVSATLKKYQGRERDMFAKLAEKYGVLSPLETESQDYGTTKESTPPSSNLKSFQATSTFGPSASFSKPPLVPTPFSSKLDESSAPKFGSIAAFASPSGFGAQTTTQQPGTFSFGGSSPAPTPFTQSTASPAPWSSPLAGKSPREILASFYEQRNPSKLGEVDKVLAKYQGNEEQLFRNLAKKYNLDPSYFGLPTTAATPSSFAPTPTSFGSSSGFGQPSVLGGGPSPLGMPHGIGQSPGFGGGQSPSPMGGFGQPSILGGAATLNSSSPFGGPAMNSSSSFGLTTSSPGFSSFQSSSSGFGATAGSSNGGSTFGSLAQSAPVGGFGSLASSVGFGQSPPVSFGTSFGGPRR